VELVGRWVGVSCLPKNPTPLSAFGLAANEKSWAGALPSCHPNNRVEALQAENKKKNKRHYSSTTSV